MLTKAQLAELQVEDPIRATLFSIITIVATVLIGVFAGEVGASIYRGAYSTAGIGHTTVWLPASVPFWWLVVICVAFAEAAWLSAIVLFLLHAAFTLVRLAGLTPDSADIIIPPDRFTYVKYVLPTTGVLLMGLIVTLALT